MRFLAWGRICTRAPRVRVRSRQAQMDDRWHNTQLDQPRNAKLGKPDGIVLVGLCPRTLPYVTAMGHEHITRVTQHMIYRLPGDARALQGDYGAMVVLQPRAKRDKLTLGRTTVVEFRRDLARVTDPAQTRGALGGMGVNTTADRMEHLQRASLLNSGWLAWGTPALPALDAQFPRVILTYRLVGVPRAGRTDPYPGFMPLFHKPSSGCRPFGSLYTGVDGRAGHIAYGGVKATLSRTIPVLPFSGCADSLKQPDAGLTVDDNLKYGRTTLHLGFLIGGDKSFHRGRTHVFQVEILGHAAKTPRVRVA
jgi:hypothetical protein